MRNVYMVGLLLVSLILASCVSPIPTVNISSMFDRYKAKKLLEDGNNTIKGSALIRQRGGGVVTCAGYSVYLFPETSYAKERITAIYGNTVRGYRDYSIYGVVRFEPDIPEYYELIKRTVCDAQGYFKFANVADGKFFVTTQILWEAGDSWQGGFLMQHVSVSDGETKEVVLAP